ncbi:MAG: hypothetical protein KDB02_11840 [Acidimicrobiales bacterium]|nr:hypothetical protein [Acidimicrobiales bacterium]
MTAPEPTVLVPAGLPIEAAARWVGGSCHAELELFSLITAVMPAAGPGPSKALWGVRAHRAEAAEAWHRRLPELREMPRERFVESAASEPGSGTFSADVAGVADALRTLIDRYEKWESVAVGPADGPTAATLQRALRIAREDLHRLTGEGELS